MLRKGNAREHTIGNNSALAKAGQGWPNTLVSIPVSRRQFQIEICESGGRNISRTEKVKIKNNKCEPTQYASTLRMESLSMEHNCTCRRGRKDTIFYESRQEFHINPRDFATCTGPVISQTANGRWKRHCAKDQSSRYTVCRGMAFKIAFCLEIFLSEFWWVSHLPCLLL